MIEARRYYTLQEPVQLYVQGRLAAALEELDPHGSDAKAHAGALLKPRPGPRTTSNRTKSG
jgi:hypothetical protein